MSENYLAHYGVKGQKKGIRNYQSYESKPTRSGMVGEERGDAARKIVRRVGAGLAAAGAAVGGALLAKKYGLRLRRPKISGVPSVRIGSINRGNRAFRMGQRLRGMSYRAQNAKRWANYGMETAGRSVRGAASRAKNAYTRFRRPKLGGSTLAKNSRVRRAIGKGLTFASNAPSAAAQRAGVYSKAVGNYARSTGTKVKNAYTRYKRPKFGGTSPARNSRVRRVVGKGLGYTDKLKSTIKSKIKYRR